MRVRLREYFIQAKYLQRALSDKRLMEHMSPTLQGEVAATANEVAALRAQSTIVEDALGTVRAALKEVRCRAPQPEGALVIPPAASFL